MNIGDCVKVIDQDITGVIVEMSGSKVVIKDLYSEYESPDDRLEFRLSDVIKQREWLVHSCETVFYTTRVFADSAEHAKQLISDGEVSISEPTDGDDFQFLEVVEAS